MNSPLEHDFVDYEYSLETKSQEDDVQEQQELDENLSTDIPLHELASDLLHCEICGQQFLRKKDLRSHINVHLGEPRVVLRRIPNLRSVKKKQDEKYWLDPDQKGTLKFTLKKQCGSDSLKLTLKKSSVSEDFTVINSNLDIQSENYHEDDLAGLRENDDKDDNEVENQINEPFENVILNQQEDDDNSKFDAETRNPLEETEKTSVDINEGDSGVGSDMANPLEREDQNIDDLQSGDNYEATEKVVNESEYVEESDNLEATCRETIENLKILGEQSSSRSANEIGEKIPTDEEENTESSDDVIQTLHSKPEISLVPKASIMAPEPIRSSTDGRNKENEQSTNSTFSWNQITTDENDKQDETIEESNETGSSSANDNTGNLLQNFLMEHQRRSQNEVSNNIPTFETEYVSLERLAETVSTCRVCNEKFKDITQLDVHKAKMGHFQCNIPECGNLIFNNPMEVSIHKMQIHGAPMSPNINQMSPHMSASSPHLNQNSPYMNHNSPHLNQTSPHMNQSSPLMNATSPHMSVVDPQTGINSQVSGTSPHQAGSPSYNPLTNNSQQMITPVNFDQLPAPVQQLAQQVQRMPLPQPQMQPTLPPGANTMIPSNIYIQPPGRPPMYRVSGPQGMYPPHMPHMYPQYGPPPPGYPGPQMGVPQMHPQMPRSRYSSIVQTPRGPRIPPPQAMPRQRLKRPMQQPVQMQQPNNANVNKQRRMDVLLPDRNEDPDCHVIAQQKRNDGVPVIQNVQGATTQSNRSDSTIHLTDSITLSVRQPGSAPAQVQNTTPSGKKPDAKAVANVLAARGITVTPAMQKGKSGEQSKQVPAQQQQQQQQQQTQQQRPAAAQNIPALNLNSAISIIPASSQRKQQEQQGQFAVPQNKQSKTSNSDVERPPRPPTVDLTQDTPPAPPLVRRGRPPRALLTCQVCDKRFQNQEMLTQHMANHRATSKLLHKCNLCPAKYPTASALMTHKQTYHKEVDLGLQNGGIELALPVVDLKSPHVVNRLSNLGIQSFIPLSQLSAQTGGYFGLPIVTIDGARNPNVCNLGALGATSILSLGPLKHLSNRDIPSSGLVK
ncbi:histone acetyltransferase KAT6A-like isoform X3 [Leptopilina boulardi]|uniref:histone acetyltransferase KAT6A-like isoform X3 n=1 Tax=Leptopilina boulardi TaxID=63433 RepID=UPI0021F52EDC|nr:histone acetyltransferase KAT6A-like isoform X3 [Leptopilina boulardi]